MDKKDERSAAGELDPPEDNLLVGLGPAALRSIRAPVGIFDIDFRILWINKAMAFIHQCDPEKVIGEFCYEALRGCDGVCEECFLEGIRRSGRMHVEEKWQDFPDGKRRWGEVQAYPVRDEDGDVSAIVVIIFETTARKHHLEQQEAYSQFLSQQLSEKIDSPQRIDVEHGAAITVNLSHRETDVLRLVTEGYTNKQISELLSISRNTVKSHVNSIFNKMAVNDRTQAAVMAIRHKLL
jgi:PAS domain S-box-containing protein